METVQLYTITGEGIFGIGGVDEHPFEGVTPFALLQSIPLFSGEPEVLICKFLPGLVT